MVLKGIYQRIVFKEIHPRIVLKGIHPRMELTGIHPKIIFNEIHPRMFAKTIFIVTLKTQEYSSNLCLQFLWWIEVYTCQFNMHNVHTQNTLEHGTCRTSLNPPEQNMVFVEHSLNPPEQNMIFVEQV